MGRFLGESGPKHSVLELEFRETWTKYILRMQVAILDESSACSTEQLSLSQGFSFAMSNVVRFVPRGR